MPSARAYPLTVTSPLLAIPRGLPRPTVFDKMPKALPRVEVTTKSPLFVVVRGLWLRHYPANAEGTALGGYPEVAAVIDGTGTVDGGCDRIDAIGSIPCAGYDEVAAIHDGDGAAIVKHSPANAPVNAGGGYR